MSWPTKDLFDVLRIPVQRYDSKTNHYESDEEVIQRLVSIYKGLVKFKSDSDTPTVRAIAVLDNEIFGKLVHPISKEPHSAFPWSLKKKSGKK